MENTTNASHSSPQADDSTSPTKSPQSNPSPPNSPWYNYKLRLSTARMLRQWLMLLTIAYVIYKKRYTEDSSFSKVGRWSWDFMIYFNLRNVEYNGLNMWNTWRRYRGEEGKLGQGLDPLAAKEGNVGVEKVLVVLANEGLVLGVPLLRPEFWG